MAVEIGVHSAHVVQQQLLVAVRPHREPLLEELELAPEQGHWPVGERDGVERRVQKRVGWVRRRQQREFVQKLLPLTLVPLGEPMGHRRHLRCRRSVGRHWMPSRAKRGGNIFYIFRSKEDIKSELYE